MQNFKTGDKVICKDATSKSVEMIYLTYAANKHWVTFQKGSGLAYSYEFIKAYDNVGFVNVTECKHPKLNNNQ